MVLVTLYEEGFVGSGMSYLIGANSLLGCRNHHHKLLSKLPGRFFLNSLQTRGTVFLLSIPANEKTVDHCGQM